MVSMDKKVFGDITIKEVIGAEPSIDELKQLLDIQYKILQKDLESKDKKQLNDLLAYQKIAEKDANSRPGAMALAQNKIKLLVEYSQKYISEINAKLESS